MEEIVHISKQRSAALLIITIAEYLLWGLFYSLQPPFYPQEAESKGATPSQYSFVFGIAYFAAFLASPLFAKYGHYIGPKWLFFVGAMVQASVSVLFGLLDFIEDTTLFLVLSYILRLVYGVMDAGAVTGVVAILMKLFPTRIALLLSCTETFFGLGYSVGPAVGGLLYAWGGFQLPFITLGSLGLLLGIPLYLVTPNLQSNHSFNDEVEEESSEKDIGLWMIIKSPDILRPMAAAVSYFLGLGIVESLLSPYLVASGGSSIEVSLAFALQGLCYMISAPICGYVVDHMHIPEYLSLLGSAMSIIPFLLIGPAPWLQPLVGPPNPTFILILMSLMGVCSGLIVPTTFVRCKNGVTNLGCKEGIQTHLRVSGLWFSTFYLGNSVGPLVGGFLVEWVGFAWTISSVAWLMLIVSGIDAFNLRHDARRHYQHIPN